MGFLVMTFLASSIAVTQDDDANAIFTKIPNPIETSLMLKEYSGYSKSSLNNADLASKYTTNAKKALNLGVYSTDLGVANIYEQNQDCINYLDAVKSLADALAIGQFFDYKTLKGIATQSGQLKKLLETTTQNVESINSHLSSNRREHISILMITGGWIEGNYQLTNVWKQKKDDKLRERIGEQKIVLDMLIPAIEKYSSKPGFSSIIAGMKKLQSTYNNVSFKTIQGENKMGVNKETGELEIQGGTSTEVIISDADASAIASAFASLRNEITQ